ncbi:hypothetical protein BJX62DRAFT_249435 [Aspergillus germanicus]
MPQDRPLSQRDFLDSSDPSNFRYDQVTLEDHPDQFPSLPSTILSSVRNATTPGPIQEPSSRSVTLEVKLGDQSPPVQCPTRTAITQRRLSWASTVLLVLSSYCTLLSGLFLIVAFLKPRYGNLIGSTGRLAPSAATLLSALAAKTIELSYVTVCIACLGQVLSYRVISRFSRGMSIADMSMRTWIMQPGSILMHWESLRYSGGSVLGVLTIISTLVSMLYTTAAEALVAPKLVWGPVEDSILVGNVQSSFANRLHLEQTCDSIIPLEADYMFRNVTCLQIRHMGPSYINYQAFTEAWLLEREKNRSVSTVLKFRPPPTAYIQESNITAVGSWIDVVDNAALSLKHGRFVQNVTAAMPHANILAAVDHASNGLPRSTDTSREGNYELDAAVPSPAVNVLCAGMNATELAPLVYTEWPNTYGMFDPATWETRPAPGLPTDDWNNRTVVDDIFEFGPDYPGVFGPVFGKLPLPYMMVVNVTTAYPSGAAYILGGSPPDIKPEYVLCSLRGKISTKCSTRYKVTASNSQFSAFCEDSNPLKYGSHQADENLSFLDRNWRYVASEWAYAMSLDVGIRDLPSSISRILMVLAPTMASLNPTLPSLSEVLAVLAGSTLIMSSVGAPFTPFWNYTSQAAPSNILEQPAVQPFNATVRQVGYASGSIQPWQAVFYPILIFAFAISLICLAFIIFEIRGKQITDFSEPQNLFTLAINSPPTAEMKGACGSGPEGDQLGKKWHVDMQEQDEHYFIRFRDDREEGENSPRPLLAETGSAIELNEGSRTALVQDNPVMREYRRLAFRKPWVASLY